MGHKYWFREKEIDRFSILPDEVAHHILSFLHFTDLTRVGTLSKTCRRFYLSIPSLDFVWGRFPLPFMKNKVELLNILDRYLFHRGDNRIQRFHVDWCSLENETVIITWICKAVRCNVEVLDLYFSVRDATMFALPSCVFLSQSLRSLSVRFKMNLEAPSLSFSCNLHFLKLSELKIVDERFFKWISCACKCIKELQLIRIRGIPNITIESSSLESFKVLSNDLFHLNISGEKLEDIQIAWRTVSSSPSKKSLNIFAPNLKHLKWEGNLMNIQNLGRLMNLEKAEIFLESEVNDFDNVLKVLSSICRAKVFRLNQQTTKNCMQALLREGSMPAPLHYICNLGIHLGNLNDDLVPAVVSLLRGMPNLITLHVKCKANTGCANSVCSGIDVEYWKLQDLAFIYQLKKAIIEVSNGSNGIEFARYILEHAENLKKMVICHLLKQSDVVRELKSKMISNATVTFKLRKHESERRSSWFGYI